MEIDVMTKQEVEAYVSQQIGQLRQLIEKLEKPQLTLLNTQQIMDRLQLKSRTSFNNRIGILVRHGMFKTGKSWQISEKDLIKYIHNLKY